jgi:hypothetical protein
VRYIVATLCVSSDSVGTRIDGANQAELAYIVAKFHSALAKWPRVWDRRQRLWLLPHMAKDEINSFYRTEPLISKVIVVHQLGRGPQQLRMSF